MESNEIAMFMDVKIDKRPECVRYTEWSRSYVKIEAVKCLPCFLRITLLDESTEMNPGKQTTSLSLCINVPGVSLTLASSRTKMHSYALCWTQNRKNCFLYFALDTELSCRRHMKWVRKSIKNLELHRKLLLEERRSGVGGMAFNAFLNLDDFHDESNNWPQRVSEIYEEIYEPQDSRRVSRRCSRTSIASGIYEEMKLPNDFDVINEELPTAPIPPPLPPLRKRFNTYETEEVPSSPNAETSIPRCSTNPETDLAKKKKYKNMLDNIFGNGLRAKRTLSGTTTTSESSQEHLADNTTPKHSTNAHKQKAKEAPAKLNKYENDFVFSYDDDITAAKRLRKPLNQDSSQLKASQTKRNSFSSPDLSKINFIDTFDDEQHIAELLNPSFLHCDDLDSVNFGASLNESQVMPSKSGEKSETKKIAAYLNLDEHNISTQLPNNFNFSACNSSSINLIASLSSNQQQRREQVIKNKILLDDLTGYCLMAPIVPKMAAVDNSPPKTNKATVRPLESASSGYSTGSYSSTASSSELPNAQAANDSAIYVNMQDPESIPTLPSIDIDFTGNLYENLLAIKAARELQPETLLKSANVLSTSTPTESPLMPEIVDATATTNMTTPTSTKVIITTVETVAPVKDEPEWKEVEKEEDEESFYQTPRKSIISIDEKIPSYYPNNFETSNSSRRRSYSPAKVYSKNLGSEKTPTSSGVEKSPALPLTSASSSTSSNCLRQLVSSKLRRERKENLYLTSPQCIIAQRKSPASSYSPTITANQTTTKTSKSKKTAAHKISENVYAVKHRIKKSMAVAATTNSTEHHYNHNNNTVFLESDDVFEHLNILRNIDFKFEDGSNNIEKLKSPTATATSPSTHHLQINQSSNTCHYNNKIRASSVGNSPALLTMTQSAIVGGIDVVATCAESPLPSPATSTATTSSLGGVKKFASLPRFKKFDLSPLRMRINNVLQRNHQHAPEL